MRKTKTKKVAKRLVVYIITMVLAVLMSVPSSADVVFQDKVSTTLDAQLQSLLKDASVDERIPVDIWLYETSTNEVREQQLHSKIGLNKFQITSNAKDDVSSEKVDEYIAAERVMYAEERVQQYASIRQDYAKIQGLQDTRKSGTRLFFSQYAPMISAELTPTEIKLLARDSRVQSIYFSPNVKLEDQGNVSISVIDADYTRDTLGYTGSGVKIGMVESGLPDINAPYFTSADIIYDENLGEITSSDISDHANTVAAIMVGQETTINGVTYEGIVPDATLYATCAEDTQNWRVRVEWLISQGVHVINMSAGFLNAGYYHVQDRWVDHIAVNHNVHFVTAAGNSTLRKVTSPGMAYNVITVGSIDDKNNLDEEEHSLAEDSCYIESRHLIDGTIPTNKPDLVAPGVGIYTPAYVENLDSGTSYAAPHVTGVVAQLCQRFWSLRVLQAGVKAMLTASISHSEHAYDTSRGDSIKYDQYGAGVVNARAVFETANAYRMVNTTFAAGSAFAARKEYAFTATAGQRIRVSLTWLKSSALDESVSHVDYDSGDSNLVNLTLCVYHPDGMLFGEWDTDDYNTEIADFFAPKTGTYKIAVCLGESISEEVEFGLSWWLQPVNNLSSSN